MFNFFSSKKVYLMACNMFRNLWETCEKIEMQRESYYNNYVRLSGRINGICYQVHINSTEIANRFRDLNTHKDSDGVLIRIFSVACACSNLGKYYKDFDLMYKSLVLNA